MHFASNTQAWQWNSSSISSWGAALVQFKHLHMASTLGITGILNGHVFINLGTVNPPKMQPHAHWCCTGVHQSIGHWSMTMWPMTGASCRQCSKRLCNPNGIQSQTLANDVPHQAVVDQHAQAQSMIVQCIRISWSMLASVHEWIWHQRFQPRQTVNFKSLKRHVKPLIEALILRKRFRSLIRQLKAMWCAIWYFKRVHRQSGR